MMKKFLTALLTMVSILASAEVRYETVRIPAKTNGLFAASTETQIRLLDVPSIYEIRNENMATQSMDMTVYNGDVLMKKLLPLEVGVTDINSTINTNSPFYATDTKDIIVANVDVSEVEAQKLTVDDLDCDGISLDSLNVNKIDVVVNQSIYDWLDNSKNELQYSREYTKYGYEKAAYLKDLDELGDYFRYQWINILINHKTNNITKIKSNRQFKIASEIRLETDSYDKALYSGNLDCLKYIGYDSVLVRFDTTENAETLVEVINAAKAKGFKVFLTYVGLDNQKPSWNPFCETYKLEETFAKYCPLADGFLLNWRSTSSHVKLLPIEFFNYLCNLSRKCNPNILIYGEVYYGKIGYLNHAKKFVYTAPENITGIVINNMGYSGYNHAYIVNKLFSKAVPGYNKMEKLAQVIGFAPYYCSRKHQHMTLTDEYNYKFEVEKAYGDLGCSTVTLLHDGVDDDEVIANLHDTCDNIMVDTKIQKILK